MTKKHIQRILIVTVLIVAGIFMLQIVGQLFIEEVIQEVSLEEPKESRVVVINEQAPYWELSDFIGQKASVSDFLGTPLVLTFWSTWNVVSADQITLFDRFLSENNTSLFKIITINNQEERSTVARFMRRGAYQVPVFLDESGEVGERYKIQTVPTTYFIDGEGIVRDVVVGPLDEGLLLEKVQIILR